MPANQFGLALAFLQTKPTAAARLLEQQPAADVAAFLTGIPQPLASGVIAQMLPYYAARIYRELPDDVSAALLVPLNTTAIAAILRHLSPAAQKSITNLLPEKLKFTLRITFNYAENSVGAWMIPNGPSLPIDCQLSEALQRISRHPVENSHELIPVVDRDGKLQGEVTAHELISNTAGVTVASIMRPADIRLRGHSNLEMESRHAGWQNRDALPVVSRQSKLIGVLRHSDLRRGLVHLQQPAAEESDNGIASQIIRAYAACGVALANTLFESEKR